MRGVAISANRKVSLRPRPQSKQGSTTHPLIHFASICGVVALNALFRLLVLVILQLAAES